MNFREQERFYQAFRKSRAASTPDARVTEMVNGLLVSKSLKKEPEVIDLQEYAKSAAASVPVNKLQEILRFQRSNGRY